MIETFNLLIILFLRSIKPFILSFKNRKKRYQFLNQFIGNYNYILVGKGPNYKEELKYALEIINKDKLNLLETKIIAINSSNPHNVNADLNIYELCNLQDHLSMLSKNYRINSKRVPILLHGRVKLKIWLNVIKFFKYKLIDLYIWEKIVFSSRFKISKIKTFKILKYFYLILNKLKLPIFIWVRGSLPSLIIFLSLNSKYSQLFIVGCPLSDCKYKIKGEVISLVDATLLSFYIAKKAEKKINYISLGKDTNPKIILNPNIELIN